MLYEIWKEDLKTLFILQNEVQSYAMQHSLDRIIDLMYDMAFEEFDAEMVEQAATEMNQLMEQHQ